MEPAGTGAALRSTCCGAGGVVATAWGGVAFMAVVSGAELVAGAGPVAAAVPAGVVPVGVVPVGVVAAGAVAEA